MSDHEATPRPSEPAVESAPADPTPTVEFAPVARVSVRPVQTRRRFGVKWVVGLLAIVLATTGVVAGARLLTPPSAGESLADWAPADSVLYAEARLDLPGDQEAKLAAILAQFPEFEGSSDLGAAIDDALDRAIQKKTDGEHDYTSEIKPWFTGAVAMAAADLPAMQAVADRDGHPHAKGLMLVGVKDQAAASAWLETIAAEMDTAPTRSAYGSAQLLESDGYAAAVTPKVLLAGDTASVKSAIDRNGSGGLASTKEFAAAAGALEPDSLASYYVNGRRYVDWALESAAGAGGPMAGCVGDLDLVPAWIGGALRAEDSAFAARGAMPHVDRPASPDGNAASALLAHLPASTLAVIDGHQVGDAIAAGIEKLRSCTDDSTTEMLQGLDTAVNAIGGWDTITAALGETAIVLDGGGSEPTGGLAFIPADRAAADRLSTQAKNLVALTGGAVTVTEESYAGATLNVVAGSDEAGAEMPRFAWVVTDSVAAFGLESWVKAVLDTTASNSLAGDPQFTRALARVDAQHTSLAYLDLAGLVEMAKGQVSADGADEFAKAAPYLEPLESLIVTSAISGALDRFNAVLSVR